jgi:hypothetical protein
MAMFGAFSLSLIRYGYKGTGQNRVHVMLGMMRVGRKTPVSVL